MNESDRLRDVLALAVPEPPPAPGRAASARRRATAARRRRTTAAGVGLLGTAAAVVAVVVAPFAMNAGDGATKAPSDPASSTSPVADFACPPPPAKGESAPPPGGDSPTLSVNPVAVRICDPGGLFGSPPLDALTTSTAEVAAAVNALPVSKECAEVLLDLGPTWDLVFLYPDGSRRTVRGTAHGCGGVQVGTVTRGDRSNAVQPLRTFQRLLWRQRASAPTPSIDVAQPRCDAGNFEKGPGLTTMPLEQPLTAERATLCWKFDSQAEQKPQAAAIPVDDLAVLLQDLNANARNSGTVSEEECRDPAQARWRISGVNAWGDRFELDGWCGVFEVPAENATTHWRPSTETRAILENLTATQPAVIETPDATTPPTRIIELWADLHNAGETSRAAALWHDDAPSPDGRVEVKVESVEHGDPPPEMSAPTALRVVTTLYWVVAAEGSWDEVHEMEFIVTRLDPDRTWRIASMTDRGVAPVGR
jgi:hypothetical protein